MCLDFHHPDPEDKVKAVNKMVLFNYSKEAIRAEIEKCEPLCANSTRENTHPSRLH